MNMISIVIPTYNEQENIAKLIKEIFRLWIPAYAGMTWAAGVAKEYEIIVVDDESPDGTADVVKRLARKNQHIRPLSHPPPRDLGKSILTGIMAARGGVIVGMDGDGNHDPRYIPSLLDVLKKTDLAVGSRFIIPGGRGPRHWTSFLFNALLKYFFGFPIWDTTSGFYAIRTKTLFSLHPPSIYYGYGEYHLRLVRAAMRKRLRIVEVPVVYPPRLHGQSKSRLGRMVVTYVRTAITGT